MTQHMEQLKEEYDTRIEAYGEVSFAIGYADNGGKIAAGPHELVIGIADGTEDSFEIRHPITERQIEKLRKALKSQFLHQITSTIEEIKSLENKTPLRGNDDLIKRSEVISKLSALVKGVE